jgi:archaellum component FlaC
MKIAAAIVALVALVGGGAFLYSDVYRTKAQEAFKQFSDWTPENIAKYPDTYLTFCEGQVNKVLDDLKARRVSISINKNKITAMRDDAAEKAQTGDTVLAKLKDLYKTTAKNNAWPATWEGTPANEEWVRNQIVQVNAQIQGKRKIVATCDQMLAKLDDSERQLPKIESAAQQQLVEIHTNQEVLKVNKLTGDLDNQLVSMKAAIQGVVTQTNDQPAAINLDSMPATSTPVDSNFQAILNK